MNGRRFILDTNAIIFLLKGNQVLLDAIKSAEWVGISVISKIELVVSSTLCEFVGTLFFGYNKWTIAPESVDEFAGIATRRREMPEGRPFHY